MKRLLNLAPLLATLVGAASAAAYGVAWRAFVPNVGAVVLGLGLVRVSDERFIRWMPAVAIAGMLATLAAPGLEGVHRWLPLGGLRLDASAALAPWILVGLADSDAPARRRAAAAALAAQLVHLVQPDAGQATALAAGLLPSLLDRTRFPRTHGLALAAAAVLLAGATWLRRDPLAPVEHVERILALAASLGAPTMAAVAVAGFALYWPQARAGSPMRWSAVAYLAAAFAVTFVGKFPVPAFGAGAAPILGWYALLAGRRAAAPSALR